MTVAAAAPVHGAPADGAAVAIEHLSIAYHGRHGVTAAVSDVSIEVPRGEIFGLVGETGCGKSTVLRAVIGLLAPSATVTGGSIRVAGHEVVGAPSSALRHLRRNRIAMIFQDPLRALNPVLRVEEQIGEALRYQKRGDERDIRTRVLETMDVVGIPDAARRLRAYPHELSGGLQQRVVIAAAIIRSPEILLADEPTTALDVTIQDQILTMLRQLCRERGMSMILVSHDMGVVAETCQRVGVMYAGRLVEMGSVGSVLSSPSHAYTAGLLASIPRMDVPLDRLRVIPGSLPDLTRPVEGCPFAPRCHFALPVCAEADMTLRPSGEHQLTACIRQPEIADDLRRVAS
jgi:oligopeptide/dipeptide ABC transporter ATP-binding protein